MTAEKETTPEALSQNTVLTIKAGFMATLIGAVFYAGAQFQDIKLQLENLNTLVRDRWSYPMTREAWKEAERLNPGFKAPEVSQIREAHRIESIR